MIFGIGTDIVEVERIRQKVDNKIFITHVFTENEEKYCRGMKKSAENFSARFAAKEAFFKALKTGLIGNFEFVEVEILNDSSGAPYICLHGNTQEAVRKAGVKSIHLTLSHEKEYAIATVILEK